MENLAAHKLLRRVQLDPESRQLYTPLARERAIAATLGFGSFGVLAAAILVHNWATAWPLIFFYAILVVNTYFSVRVFATITPPDASSQKNIDFIIICIYLSLATQFEHPLGFTIIAALLFTCCIIKYKLLARIAPGYRMLLRRKIILDWLGAFLCTIAALGVVANYSHIATTFLTIINALANIYLLIIKPFYALS